MPPKIKNTQKQIKEANTRTIYLSKVLLILFLLFSFIGSLGYIKGVKLGTFTQYMWDYLSDLKLDESPLYHLEVFRYTIMFISFLAASLGSIVCFIYFFTKIYKGYTNNKLSDVSNKNIFAKSFIYPLQYVVICSLMFDYSYLERSGDVSTISALHGAQFGWGAYSILVGLVCGLASVLIEENTNVSIGTPSENRDYILTRVALLCTLSILVFGLTSYVHFTYTTELDIYDYPLYVNTEANIFYFYWVALSPEISYIQSGADYRVLTYVGITLAFLAVIAAFYTFYHLLKCHRRRSLVGLSIILASSLAIGFIGIELCNTFFRNYSEVYDIVKKDVRFSTSSAAAIVLSLVAISSLITSFVADQKDKAKTMINASINK
ncbi:MAG: hypothetical protein MJ208_04265 [Bacilli bacterium]|nr:hypothetical protein [Bacilli bacterium]